MDLKRTPIQQPVYTQVVEKIRELIRTGELAPGDQLLPERQLAEKLQVSRSSVREALALLAGKGIIEISPRGGAYVKRVSLEEAIEPLAQSFFQERRNVFHLFEVRQIIETQAVRLAAQRRDDVDIQHLYQLNQRVADDIQNARPADQSDTLFHVGLVETAKNPLLSNVMGTLIMAMMQVYGPVRQRLLSNPHEAPLFVQEHERIIDAIAQGNAEQAATLVAQHIDHARKGVEAAER